MDYLSFTSTCQNVYSFRLKTHYWGIKACAVSRQHFIIWWLCSSFVIIILVFEACLLVHAAYNLPRHGFLLSRNTCTPALIKERTCMIMHTQVNGLRSYSHQTSVCECDCGMDVGARRCISETDDFYLAVEFRRSTGRGSVHQFRWDQVRSGLFSATWLADPSDNYLKDEV